MNNAEIHHRKSGRLGLNPSVVGDIVKFLVVLAVLSWIVYRGGSQMNYNWQWYRIPQYLLTFSDDGVVPGPLLSGLLMTFKICLASLLLAFGIGLTTALLRLSGSFAAKLLARTYLELIRNTPLLVQLFFVYFVLSPVLGFSRFASAVIALSFFEGAYASEIFRAGIIAIPQGQWEAARSSGLGTRDTYVHIILPQTLRLIMPPLISQAISLVKDSALVSTIAIYDLTMQGQAIIAETYLVFEVWFVVAAIYLFITVSLSIGVSMIEKHLRLSHSRRGRRGVAARVEGKGSTALGGQPMG